jgi:hypothetical protein
MTKRDYVRLAEIIRKTRQRALLFKSDPHRWAAGVVISDMQREIGDWLAGDNPRFDPDTWVEACKP